MADSRNESFSDMQTRLEEILDIVNDPSTSLDDALALCEEAVSLGLRASDVLEEDISLEEEQSQGSGEDGAEATEASNAKTDTQQA